MSVELVRWYITVTGLSTTLCGLSSPNAGDDCRETRAERTETQCSFLGVSDSTECSWGRYYLPTFLTRFLECDSSRTITASQIQHILHSNTLSEFHKEAAMAQSAQGTEVLIKSVFALQVAIRSTEGAEAICNKNQLSFTELLKPFSQLGPPGESGAHAKIGLSLCHWRIC